MTAAPDGRHLRHMRDVISVLVMRDQKSRYKSTMMGVIWAVASPVLFLLTFYLLFRVILPLNIPYYASHLFIALVVWAWFSSTTIESVNCIVGNAGLVNQPRFPVAALPLATATSNFVTLILTTPLLVVILYAEGAQLGSKALLVPVLLAVQYLFTLAIAYLVASVNVRFRDMQYIVPILLQLGYFSTPIFYDLASIPPEARRYLMLNPMVTLIEAHRAILIRDEWPDWTALGLVAVGSALLLVLTYRTFIRASARFLEEV
jgi:lipopolysaccharide transport system permease protein